MSHCNDLSIVQCPAVALKFCGLAEPEGSSVESHEDTPCAAVSPLQRSSQGIMLFIWGHLCNC